MTRRIQKKKTESLDDEYTILAIDQTRQVLSTLIYARFPEGKCPSLPVMGAWESIKLLGAVSDISETFTTLPEDADPLTGSERDTRP